MDKFKDAILNFFHRIFKNNKAKIGKLNFNLLGIDNILNLYGSVKNISNNELPIVFLLDEKHNDDESIKRNIANAIELIEKANVKIVGVESHSGGRQWDQYYQEYLDEDDFEDDFDNIVTNGSPEFANLLKEKYYENVHILGVECKGMLDKMSCTIHNEEDLQDNALNIQRSRHFIKTLFELRTKKANQEGNLILNCGRDHNNHIENWIINGEIDEIVGCEAVYVRLNTL